MRREPAWVIAVTGTATGRNGERAMDHHHIGAGSLTARIAAKGAELTSLVAGGDGELIWQAGPEWPRHAPVLFPIVGRLADDTLIHAGRGHRLTQHGFARDSLFRWIERAANRAVLELAESEATLSAYPFRFRLWLSYEIDADGLTVATHVANSGEEVLPFSVGAHPAFRWPLVKGVAKVDHSLLFERPEAGPARLLTDGLLDRSLDLPSKGAELPLSPDLFSQDALVLPGLASRSVRYRAHDGQGRVLRSLAVSWEGYRDLGLWSKPTGADFLCIEPWAGTASPRGWQGEFADKPGVMLLAPGEERAFTWRVAV